MSVHGAIEPSQLPTVGSCSCVMSQIETLNGCKSSQSTVSVIRCLALSCAADSSSADHTRWLDASLKPHMLLEVQC